MRKNPELVFFTKWLRAPLRVASVTPSGSRLARAMVSGLPQREGLVIELGGGTGPITHALLEAGITPQDLVVIERDPHFHQYLVQRFPGISVLRGDAFDLQLLLARLASELPVRAVVSGLPLVPMNAAAQKRLLQQALSLADGQAPFIQFSYGLASPLKKSVQAELDLSVRCVAQVWRNIPPAKVWVYQRNQSVQAQTA